MGTIGSVVLTAGPAAGALAGGLTGAGLGLGGAEAGSLAGPGGALLGLGIGLGFGWCLSTPSCREILLTPPANYVDPICEGLEHCMMQKVDEGLAQSSGHDQKNAAEMAGAKGDGKAKPAPAKPQEASSSGAQPDPGNQKDPKTPGDTPGAGTTPGGLNHSKHSKEQAEKRGFSDKAIDAIVQNNGKDRVGKVDAEGRKTWEYTDPRGNTVVTNEQGGIVTVYSPGPGGNFIPKPGGSR